MGKTSSITISLHIMPDTEHQDRHYSHAPLQGLTSFPPDHTPFTYFF